MPPSENTGPSNSGLSDPSRAGRGDRRKAQQTIDAAFAAGRLTSADHQLRSQRVDAAQTAGDLTALTRDLPDPKSLGSAIDPATLAAMRVGNGSSGTPSFAGRPLTVDLSGKTQAKRVILFVVIGVVLLCGLGVAGVVMAIVGSVGSHGGSTSETPPSSVTDSPNSAPTQRTADLLSAPGWRSLLAQVKAQTGGTEVYNAVVYPGYAAVQMVSGDGMKSGVFRDGTFLGSSIETAPSTQGRVDLADIDADLIAKLPQQVASEVGIEHPTGTYLVINAVLDDPRIMVFVQAEGRSDYRVFSLDGAPRQF